MMNQKISNFLEQFKKESDIIFKTLETGGYWSNLSRKENTDLISALKNHSTREAIKKVNQLLEDVIFSEKRSAGLQFLNLNGSETALDFGCMWGALTIPLAKMVSDVLGIDQTIESLQFCSARVKEEELHNIKLLCGNLRNISLPIDSFDIAIVNGVLEWIPVVEEIELEKYWYGKIAPKSAGNPKEMQIAFLKNILTGLKPGGRLFLAIENRYDYKMFFGIPDPHTGLLFTSIAPRWLANLISLIRRKREYRPWTYSFSNTEKLLKNAGFSKVNIYACWPDYRFPDYIVPYQNRNNYFIPTSTYSNGKHSIKRLMANKIETFLFKFCNLNFFAPSIILIAEK